MSKHAVTFSIVIDSETVFSLLLQMLLTPNDYIPDIVRNTSITKGEKNKYK